MTAGYFVFSWYTTPGTWATVAISSGEGKRYLRNLTYLTFVVIKGYKNAVEMYTVKRPNNSHPACARLKSCM